MNIIIVGAGKVGFTIAKYLSLEDDNITVIDKSSVALERINNNLDAMCVEGNCTNLKVLLEAGIKKADVVISVTGSDELNMLCSLAAKKLGAKYTISRVRDPGYDEEIALLTDAIGIDLAINPEKITAAEISRLVRYPSVSSIDAFAGGKVTLLGFNLSEDLHLSGKTLAETDFIKGKAIICGVERNDEVIIPKGDFVLRNGDKIYLIGEHKGTQELFKTLGRYKKKVKNVMIIGGGKITYYLAKALKKNDVSCKIIESNIEKCNELAELLEDSLIINGDGLDEDLLLSENIEETESFITLTGRDEDNIVASIFATNKNVNNVITKVTRNNYYKIAKNVGINSIIDTKLITANRILKYVRGVKCRSNYSIENVYTICNKNAEAIEFIVSKDMKNINCKLKDIKFKNNCLVAIIVRNNEIIIPTGEECMMENDKVIIISDKPILDVNDMFKGGAK